MRRKPDLILKDLEIIAKNLGRFTPEVLQRLYDIDKYGPNDYGHIPSSGSTSGRPSGQISDPVLNKVASRMTRPASDPIGDCIKGLDRKIGELRRMSDGMVEQLLYVVDRQKSRREAAILTCACCSREVMGTPADRLRSGYCEACYKSWIREGKAYRPLFELNRRASLEAETAQK